METDKATLEVETYASGTLLHVLAEPGDIVAVGAPIAIIGKAGENYQSLLGQSGASASAQVETEAEETHTAAESSEPTAEPVSASGAPAASAAGSNGQNGHLPDGVKASPVARRLADDKGIDLSQVAGTGPEGRIIKRDVEQFKPGTIPAPVPAPVPASAPSPATAPKGVAIGAMPTYRVMSDVPHEVIPTSRLRATIARRMVESKQFVPHFTVTTAMDTTALLTLRQQINSRLDDDHKVTVNDLVIKATALTLREFPNLNTHYHGEELVHYKDINIGIAVALPEGGLINVVAKNADITSLSAMAIKNKKMINSAREGKVRPEDIEGSTFTVSNLGAFGVEHFTAIINPPEAGIMAVGASQRVPVVNADGELTIGNVMKCTISIDHRVSDGAEGAEFMKHFRELIEDPMRLLV